MTFPSNILVAGKHRHAAKVNSALQWDAAGQRLGQILLLAINVPRYLNSITGSAGDVCPKYLGSIKM